MDVHLRRQIEEIIDTTSGPACRVIVQMEPPKDVKKFITATTKAVAGQRQAISARVLVPPRAEAVAPAKKLTMSKLGGASSQSARSIVFSQLLAQMEKTAVKLSGKEALKPLVESDLFKKAAEKRPTAEFSLAASAAITIAKSDLSEMAKSVPGIAAVFPSRWARVPPVRTAGKELPPAVADNRGHTWGLGRTGALAVWGAYNARGAGVKVAVLDTGYDPAHPDLKDKLAGFAEFDEHGQVVAGKDTVAAAYDDGTHGTHVAGTILGGRASGRWIGMAPEAKILSGLVLKGGVGSSEQILAGMQWAVDQGADVISMSLGGLDMNPDVFDTYTLAILNASRLGIPVVAAIGNEGAVISGLVNGRGRYSSSMYRD
jgi:subtilisin family serine protease